VGFTELNDRLRNPKNRLPPLSGIERNNQTIAAELRLSKTSVTKAGLQSRASGSFAGLGPPISAHIGNVSRRELWGGFPFYPALRGELLFRARFRWYGDNMAWLPKIAMTLSIGVAAAQPWPIIVDPEDELLSMLQEWRQQKRGNPVTPEPTSAGEGTADASVKAGGCLINAKPTNPCPYVGDTTEGPTQSSDSVRDTTGVPRSGCSIRNSRQGECPGHRR
jgi:hypothetical protein